jgi:nicotinamide mononucleotide adenylyltransferase
MIGAFGKPNRRFAGKLQPSHAGHGVSLIRKMQSEVI